MENFFVLAIASLITISVLLFAIWRFAHTIKALDAKIIKTWEYHKKEIADLKLLLAREKKEYLLKIEKEFIQKMNIMAGMQSDRFLSQVGLEQPVFTMPLKHSREVVNHFYTYDYMPTVEKPIEGKAFKPQKMQISFLENAIDHEYIKSTLARNLAEWMIKNNFVFGKFDTIKGETTFGFYYYER